MALSPVSHASQAPTPVVPSPPTLSPSSVSLDLSPVAPLDALLKQLDQMNVLHTGVEEGTFSGVRLFAQRILFRVIRPYVFQQQHLNTQVISALRHAAAALRREEQVRDALEVRVRELTREVLDLKRDLRQIKRDQE